MDEVDGSGTKLLSWGANSCGQLGQGTKCEECVKPTNVLLDHIGVEPSDIVSIVAGAGHSLFLIGNGHVFGCGSNQQGQLLDLGNEEVKFKPIPSLAVYKIRQIATKWDTSYAISSDGTCLAWGPNNFRQQGHFDRADDKSKIHVITHKAKQVEAGLRHVLVLLEDGFVYSAGDNTKGQLGRNSSLALEKVNGLENVIQIACGQNHNLALTNDGKIFAWGCNKFGQLSIENQKSVCQPRFICSAPSTKCKLLSGWTHSAFLDEGKLTNWGRNKYSQLGTEQTPFECEPRVLNFMPIREVEFGSEHCVGITIDNEVVSWGWNEHGNCGTGDTTDVTKPTHLNIGKATKIGAGAGQSFAVVV